MSEVVERVARAMSAELRRQLAGTSAPGCRRDDPTSWTATGGVIDLEAIARAAIEAMREPTETMLGEAFWSAHDERADLVWRDMIEAALAPDQSGRLPADAAQVEREGSRESP